MAGFRHSYVTFVLVAYVGAMSAGAAESTDGDSSTLGEIVVTAQKRSESLMNVPIAVTAVSGDSLKSLGAVSTGDLKLVTPGLVYDSLDGFPFFYIRGVGTDFSQPGVSSAVGIYSDGIYQNFAQAQAQSLLDVERVEVLKGPQGTLYGRNSTAGAINIVTRKPSTDDWIGDFTVGFSNYAGQAISGYLSGPIADGFSTSLAGFYNRRESYIFNGATGERLPEVTSEGVRTKLDYDFADTGNVEVALWYFRNVDDEAGAFNQLQGDATGVVLGGHASTARGVVYNDFPVFFNLTQFGTHIKGSVPFEYFDLVSLTGFQKWQSDSGVDFDATSAPIAFFFSNSPTKTVSQEFQFVSKASGPLQWVGGLYYLYNRGAFDPLNVPAGSTPPLTVNDPLELIRTSSTAKASAIYGQGSYKFGADDAWRVTVGGRYSREKAAENPATVSVQGIGQVAAIPGADTTFTNFSPKATIDYSTTNSLSYFTVSKGFKSGAYNLAAPGNLTPVQPEKLTAYELGYKLTFAEGKARLEASLYDYDYRNLQVEFITNQVAPVSLGNADKATSRGLELSLVTQPITGLNLNAGVAYMEKATYDRYGTTLANGSVIDGGVAYFSNGAGNSSSIANFSGNELAHAPKFSGNLGASYDVPVKADSVRFSANLYSSGKYYFSAQNTAQAEQSAYTTLNARITWQQGAGNWKASIYGNNVTDRVYYSQILVNALGTIAQYALPRTYGVEVGYSFR